MKSAEQVCFNIFAFMSDDTVSSETAIEKAIEFMNAYIVEVREEFRHRVITQIEEYKTAVDQVGYHTDCQLLCNAIIKTLKEMK